VEGVKQRAEDASSVFTGFKVEFAIEPDEGWEIYQHFCRWLTSPTPPKTTISA
jgi:hypothetical protein